MSAPAWLTLTLKVDGEELLRHGVSIQTRTPTCPTCRHHTLDDKGDHWCALGISTAGRVRGLVTHLQPFGCSLHEGKETGDDE